MGIPEKDLANGSMVVGHVEKTPVLIARRGAEVFAIDATCTHYARTTAGRSGKA
jgi:nitrite reductase/ring-hydroxylating ferredoxin subunit